MTAPLPPSFSLDVARRQLSLDPRDPAFVQDPYASYARILEAAPIVFWEQLGVWCLFRYADIDRVLRDRRFGREILHVTTREALGWPQPPEHTRDFDAVDAWSLLEREPPEHTRLRRALNRAFVSHRVERWRPVIEAMAYALIDAFPEGPFDLLSAYAQPIPVRLIARFLGVPEAKAPQLLEWSHRMVAMYGVARTRVVEDAANGAARDFSRYIGSLIEARRHAPGDDLLSVLIAADDGGTPLRDEELISTAILLLNAGHEATVHALGNAVHLLLASGVAPDAWATDDARTDRVVEEALRLAPPLHLFKRYVLEPLELHGALLQQGEQIAVVLGAAGRDPQQSVCPHQFRVEGAAPVHASFGAGIHFCVGAPLARLELRVALQCLFRRCPTLALVTPARLQDSWHFHGLERLIVRR